MYIPSDSGGTPERHTIKKTGSGQWKRESWEQTVDVANTAPTNAFVRIVNDGGGEEYIHELYIDVQGQAPVAPTRTRTPTATPTPRPSASVTASTSPTRTATQTATVPTATPTATRTPSPTRYLDQPADFGNQHHISDRCTESPAAEQSAGDALSLVQLPALAVAHNVHLG